MKRELYLLLDYPACSEKRAKRILRELQNTGVELLGFVAKGTGERYLKEYSRGKL